jgi:two-component system, NtrC family, sensor kinase
MSSFIPPLIVSVVITVRYRRFARINNLPELENKYKYLLVFTIALFAITSIFSESVLTVWLWNLYVLGLVAYSLNQKELQQLRSFLVAFIPYVLVVLLNDLTELISKEAYKISEPYFKSAITLSFIWMAAIWYSQNRQAKVAEKERIKRQHEDELNRAIAQRKVELEGLVTERTAELTRQKEELEMALTELRTTQSQLIQSEKMASLGELTAGIAHEIQNPLNFVNNFSEVSRELLDEMQAEIEKDNKEEAGLILNDIKTNLEKINYHGKRADNIVKGMLQHSRANTGQKELTDINSLADEYLRLAYHGLRAKDKTFNAKFETDLDPAVGRVSVIPQEIGRVILNLLTNAFYVVTEKKKRLGESFNPTVIISTKKTKQGLEIKVSDNGDGIPSNILDKIFQPFFTTKPTGQGTGLGLSMCYEIVTQGHGGELKVETKEGEGSVFTVCLPIEKVEKHG